MRRPDIAPRKLPTQRRAVATVDAIVEAAAYILTHNGPGGFTANRVAEKAGVNVASFYQYFPNKEALLFHIVQRTWEAQLARLSPILFRPGNNYAVKLRMFLREFFLIEEAEVDLRRALRAASIDLRRTEEFQRLTATGAALTRTFLTDALGDRACNDFAVDFIVLLTTGFAENTTDQGTSGDALMRQADLIAEMLVAQFGIPSG